MAKLLAVGRGVLVKTRRVTCYRFAPYLRRLSAPWGSQGLPFCSSQVGANLLPGNVFAGNDVTSVGRPIWA